jgi:hypothetical protein
MDQGLLLARLVIGLPCKNNLSSAIAISFP